MSHPLLQLSHVKKSFGSKAVINDISFTMHTGDLFALIGPSGCGKSTLLKCINGLEYIDAGAIQIHETVIESPAQIGEKEFLSRTQKIRKNVGMVFQSFNLFPHLTALENTMKAQMVVQNKSEDEARSIGLSLLNKVGLKNHADHYPHEMSGGQQQRAAIARALALSPQILLYDEPTSALDPYLVDEVLSVMRQLDEEGMTQIIVTHEMRFARDVADKIIFIDHGAIVEMGSPQEIFTKPKDERTQKFLRHFL